MAWRTLTVVFLIALALPCAARAADTRSLEAGGLTRTYIVHRPAGLAKAKPVPLVVVLHGGFGTGTQAERSYNWDAQADRRDFVAVYPDGINRSWNAGGKCCGRAFRDGVDDVAFLTSLIETVARAENIDRRRVYLTGISNGAAMSYRYACEGRFPVAAIGAVAGSLAIPCARPHAVSVMEIHGLADARVPFAGGHGNGVASDVDWLGVDATLGAFRKADDCPAAAAEQNGVVRKSTARCSAGREVVSIAIEGAGHQWPGANPHRGPLAYILRLDPPSAALDATEVLWAFFAHHSTD